MYRDLCYYNRSCWFLFLFLIVRRPPRSTRTDTLFPYAPLFRSIPVSFHVDLSGAADYRGYSTESRFANYDRAVGRTLDHNPILGLGVKPREQDNHIAVGSHSTFVSAFTKSGTLGLSLVVAYLVLLPAYRDRKSTRLNSRH